MPRNPTIPKYGHHKPTGQGRTTLKGKTYYFGPYEDEASYNKYKKFVAEYLAGGMPDAVLPTTDGLPDILVSELMVRYLELAKTYYVKDGASTGEYENICYEMQPFRALCANTLVRVLKDAADNMYVRLADNPDCLCGSNTTGGRSSTRSPGKWIPCGRRAGRVWVRSYQCPCGTRGRHGVCPK